MSNESERIALMIADDHAIVREGLRTLLESEPDIDIVAEAADGESTLVQAKSAEPSVLLLDLMLPDMDGIELVGRLQQLDKPPHVIMLTSSFGDDLRVRDAIEAGAIGYLLKDVDRAALLQAIRRAAKGEGSLHPEAQAQLIRSTRAAEHGHENLTPREFDVLKLIANGRSNKRIAGDLGLSEGTVKGYVSAILDKLGVVDRTQAALYAVKNRLI